MKVLVVDDSKAMRMIIMRTLKSAGFGSHDYIQASSGAEGLEMVSKESPNLILSDWNMPEMSGIDFLKELRKAGDKTAFGFITSESGAEAAKTAMESGAKFLITKPFTAEKFENTLSPILS